MSITSALRHFAMMCVVTVFAFELVAGEFNPDLNIGDKAPEWKSLPGVDDQRYSLADFKSKDVLVVFFTCNSCPYAIEYEDRIAALVRRYDRAGRQVGFVGINVNKVEADLLPAMKVRAQQKEFRFPYLFDESQQIAKDFGAGYTPEFFVLNKERRVVFMGALDDNSNAEQVKQHYVAAAIDALLAGQEPVKKETPPVGCRIRMQKRRRGQ